jgi:hypothetical protein
MWMDKKKVLLGLLLVLILGSMITLIVFLVNSENKRRFLKKREKINKPKYYIMTPGEISNFVPPSIPSVTHKQITISNPKFTIFPAPDNLKELEKKALSNFILSRYSYCENPQSPLITIVTRCSREREVKRNICLASKQLIQNYEHVVLMDTKKEGMQIAETALYAFRNEFRGKYIVHIDDDDYICNQSFTYDIQWIIETFSPEMIMINVWHSPGNRVIPNQLKIFLPEGEITTSNFLVRSDMYRKNISVVAYPHAGDYLFYYNCLKKSNLNNLVWIDDIYIKITKGEDETLRNYIPDEEFVTVQIEGGLGNQMFEIANAYGYARDHNKTLVVDKSQTIVSLNSGMPRPTYWKHTFHWVNDIPLRSKYAINFPNEYKESTFVFSAIPYYLGNVKLFGYFQSARYFEKYKSDIIRLFTENKSINLPDFLNKDDNETISIHFRRTDYVNNSFHPNQDSDYYLRALRTIIEKLNNNNITLCVFSDDLEWCKSNVPNMLDEFSGKYNIVVQYMESKTENDISSEERDMILMSKCKHHIIANSSFSWWGAYLCTYSKSMTIAPAVWFYDKNVDDWSTIYVENWIII